jgi:hypothetical protein
VEAAAAAAAAALAAPAAVRHHTWCTGTIMRFNMMMQLLQISTASTPPFGAVFLAV